jgi:ABC-2 type transport system ATP-binding protein
VFAPSRCNDGRNVCRVAVAYGEEAMGAASYIGRIGGLAVALGVGTAIITGQGVAYATTDGGSQDGGSQTGGSQEGGSQEGGSQDGGSQSGSPQIGASQTDGETGTNTGTTNNDPGNVEDKNSGTSEPDGRHRATETTSGSVRATTIIRRLSDAADATAKRLADAIHDAADATNGVKASPPGTQRSSRSSSQTERTLAPGSSDTDNVTDTDNVVTNEFVNGAPTIKEWLASPRVAAGRAGDTMSTDSTQPSLWTPRRFLTGQGPLITMTAAPATTTVGAPNLMATVLGDVFNPFAGNSPTTPTPDSPLSWMLLGASRREIGVDSITSQSLLAPADSITYAPVVEMVNGVITGMNDGPTEINGNPLTFTVVGDPSGGGKVLIDPATGDFSFLPDFSSVQNKTSEEFSVLVAETTPFDAALMQIPLVGSFVPQVLVVLYQVPIVNVVLAPLIGQSAVVPVTVDVSGLVYVDATRKPVAFTVKVPSPVDGALISTNFFPATTVVDGTATTAPTILNGPGLATAGNTDPTSTSTVSGPVSDLQALRDAGYNVVTWDPRGEFDSGGVLQLDSPQYEGQDVRGIMDWLTADENRPYTFQAFDNDIDTDANTADASYGDDDPAIGMVGGSYGGGIQLVTAGVDPRVDVIVPGIAWNSLEDSLYPRQVFKTAYSALLLLGLVQTGARINPQIYGGVITGALLGVLTPGQRDLLSNRGPWYLTANIDIPTLFIQGTVDVLFPLQQALNNADTLGTPAEDIKMIWFCGGHGACLTLNPTQTAEQSQMLVNTTIDELNYVLMNPDNEESDIPKFQFVDQNGQWYTAKLIPTDDGFYTGSTPVVTDNGGGGLLAIFPLLGGSGPESAAPLPYSLGLGSEATNAISIPLDDAPDGTTVVGAPHLTFDYSGIGTSRAVYAQIVDKNTGLVVGNLVTPIPVTLDGRTHSVDIAMEDIVYTYGDSVPDGSDLELQIVGSATPYLNLTQYGFINVSDVSVSLPTPGTGAGVMEETLPPVMV